MSRDDIPSPDRGVAPRGVRLEAPLPCDEEMPRPKRCVDCDWIDVNIFGLEICGHYASIEANPGGVGLARMRRRDGLCGAEARLFHPGVRRRALE